jgi:hypothetical protein
VAKQEVCVANGWNIHALRYSKGEWVASVWTSRNKRESVPVEDAFVKSVIGPTNYKKRKFRSGEMIPLRKLRLQYPAICALNFEFLLNIVLDKIVGDNPLRVGSWLLLLLPLRNKVERHFMHTLLFSL